MHGTVQEMKNRLIQIFIKTSILALLLSLSPILPVLADNSNTLQVTNLARTNFSFTQEQLLAMPKTEVNADLYCNGALVTSGNWVGVSLSYILDLTQVTSNVSSIDFLAIDGYSVTIPTDLAVQPQIIIAYEKDNASLTEGLRLILPGYNGGSWIANITLISMSTSPAAYPSGLNPGDISPPSYQTPNDSSHPTAQQDNTTPQQYATPEPSPPSNQTATPTNVTNSNQSTTATQLLKNAISGIPVVFFYLIATALMLVLAVLGGLAYTRKKTGGCFSKVCVF